VPVMKRDEWLKLCPTEKVGHRIQRTTDRIDSLQRRYNRERSAGRTAEPIQLLEAGLTGGGAYADNG
jgi:hypothetical protein